MEYLSTIYVINLNMLNTMQIPKIVSSWDFWGHQFFKTQRLRLHDWFINLPVGW